MFQIEHGLHVVVIGEKYWSQFYNPNIISQVPQG